VDALSATADRTDLERGFVLPAESGSVEFDVGKFLDKFKERKDSVDRYIMAYRQYCWPVNSIDDYRIAPFHMLATESRTYFDRDHPWHMDTLARICSFEPQIMVSTPFCVVDVTDNAGLQVATGWWENLTGDGGEGMVVKPFSFIARGGRGLVQPALKCRGREYLRIIYGAEYTQPQTLERLRSRALGAKRALAMREFALGVEGLERFIRREPLRRVHECVFGVLALESEPVDPRL
jgi:protein phosphatase